jgi:hypothetical protein
MSFIKNVLTTKNVGKFDRIIRAIPSIVVAVLYFNGSIGGGLAIGLGTLSAMLLVTSLTGACSIYYMLGYSTCPISGKPNPKMK